MSAPPPPPPPPPPPGMGGPPPPPPPPPPPGGAPGAGNLPSKAPKGVAKERGALLGDIRSGTRLKKTATNDRSGPLLDKPKNSGGPVMGAPAVPKPPGAAAAISENRLRSNSDTGGGLGAIAEAPQLGGLFAGGMPMLKKTRGGVNTGADRDASYSSDPETRTAPKIPKLPSGSAPRPPGAPPGAPPRPLMPPTSDSAPTNTLAAAIGKKPLLKPVAKPPVASPLKSATSSSNIPPRAPPPLPGSRAPPIPPAAGRKPSAPAPPPPPPPPPSSASVPPSAPPPPPAPVARPAPVTPTRSTIPPPPVAPPIANGSSPAALAAQAARNAFTQRDASPAAPPPPPPPALPIASAPRASAPPLPSAPPPPSSRLSPPPTSAPPPPSSRPDSGLQPARVSSASYTLTPPGTNGSTTPERTQSTLSRSGSTRIDDSRWRFQDDNQLPKPRDFKGGPRRYRAGRVSSVPLDLASLR